MFRPQIQKTYVLALLALLCLICVFISSNSFVKIDIAKDIPIMERNKFDLKEIHKNEAVIKMEEYMSILKQEMPSLDSSFIINDYIDPNQTGLIFEQIDTTFMTGEGSLPSKQTALKPNFAALVIEMFYAANLNTGDTIAVAMTGSMPGANLALYAACETIGVTPIVISSVGSSEYGAVHPNFTWLDMEKVLFECRKISAKSFAASLGGKGDLFKGKVDDDNITYAGLIGREKAKIALDRNIDSAKQIIPPERNNLSRSIFSRLETYGSIFSEHSVMSWYKDSLLVLNKQIEKYKRKRNKRKLKEIDRNEFKNDYKNYLVNRFIKYSAYVNIGGGVASMGIGGNEKIAAVGVIDLEIAKQNLDQKSVAIEFAKKDVPIIAVHTIQELIKDANGNNLIQYGGKERFKAGEGPLFKYKYNSTINWVALLIALGSVTFVGIYSFRKIKEHTESYEPESIL